MSHAGANAAREAPAPHLAPGRMGVRLAILSLAIGLAAINTGNNLLYVMLSLILGLATVSLIAARRAMRTLRVRAVLPDEAVCGEPFLITVEAEGRFPWLPQAWIDVRIEGMDQPVTVTVPLRSKDGRGTATARVTPSRRGVRTHLTLAASTGYPLDLHLSRASFAWRGEMVILPRIEPVRLCDTEAAGRDPGPVRSALEQGAGAELRNVRAYTWQDDARLMHWRASARAGHPMVRELDREHERRLDLVLDTEAADDAAFEAVVSRAASLLEAARRERVPAHLHSAGTGRDGLSGAAAGRFLAQVTPTPPGARAGPAGSPVPGAVILSCAASRGAREEASR